jgi:hypothetical protein
MCYDVYFAGKRRARRAMNGKTEQEELIELQKLQGFLESSKEQVFEETVQRINHRREKSLREQRFRETENQFWRQNRWAKVKAIIFFILIATAFAACWVLAAYYVA